MSPIVAPESRCECSANIAMSVSQPAGLTEPFESGQSTKAIPAPMLVVNAPNATSTKTQMLAQAAKSASRGWWVAVSGAWEDEAMSKLTGQKKVGNCRPQTL